jgi:hypothetical protein
MLARLPCALRLRMTGAVLRVVRNEAVVHEPVTLP